MDKVIVYLDDPAYARQGMPEATGPTHWLLVACAGKQWAHHRRVGIILVHGR